MEEKEKTAVKTYEDLKQAIVDSGRPYDHDAIERAYLMAEKAHAGQKRLSGELYVSHPIAVACLVVDLGLDTNSVIAALLHDVVEDTDITSDDVRAAFGSDVALLVDGVTKLTQMTFSSVEEQQAENLRKMLLAMSHDVRVMLIKLCDRLHNMRTGDGWPEQKRRDKALETMEVYAPIAHRLGMSNVKEELEDRSLRYLDPVGYQDINDALTKNGAADSFIAGIAEKIRERLAELGMGDCTIKKRVKSVYGIYRKMYMQNRSFEEIYDVYAVRIILNTVGECYNALGVIHDMYHPIPSRFKDYISTPKPNLYKSLHTTVIGHEGIPFEVQIRTWEMDQTAEYGVAAHWKYKAGVSAKDKLDDRIAWVRQLLESQRESDDAGDLLHEIKSELLPEDVFAFTPRGDVINLPAGATAIDFAYAIHSAVGNRMVGAKANGRIVPIDHKVATGEIIEVITGPQDKGPSRDWLNIVATSEARNKIRNWFKKERKEENIAEGKAALEKELRRNLVTIPAEKYDAFMADLARRQRLNTPEELYAAIGYGGLQLSRLMIKIKDEYARLLKEKDPAEVLSVPIKKHKASEGVIVEGLDNCVVKFAKCCNPLPGDDIIGFITRGFGVSIHKRSCPNASSGLLGEEAPRWVSARWADSVKESFKSSLEISAMDRDGLMADVAVLIAEMHLPCYAISARQLPDGRATMTLTIGVNNTEHLNTVISRLRKIKSITTINRV
ncbi:MAG: bifunctional (p)ppGpp synthetase/guanosine-3',5'-bis(diphosphate) 3'-pyrophosphohydrolase [Subdoligranulum sp.]|nr:bifunctional (p)ppGpp synthetase/guanosine-3',5'-bis(diphosphate) 3'-pyrophosphohydrolase [Subdoligranulum sp.]